MAQEGHRYAEFESRKYDPLRPQYHEGVKTMKGMGYTWDDMLEHFPAFVGHFGLARLFTLYELYKQTLEVSGHIAEMGVYKGSGSLLFGKLVRLFEPSSMTMVHGFDWFEGMATTEEEKYVDSGSYTEKYERVLQLVKAQGMDNIVKIHKVDATKDLVPFFQEHAYMQFKLVFLDAGIYEVTKASIEAFWPRITPGGILILDQYNHELSPGETRAVRDVLPNAKVRTLPFGWMPTAYIVKE
jgi:Macrocin-O-methyltransferase (TylF)